MLEVKLYFTFCLKIKLLFIFLNCCLKLNYLLVYIRSSTLLTHKILLFLCQLCFISFTVFTYSTFCLQINTLFTSLEFCVKLAIWYFQCTFDILSFTFTFCFKLKLYFTFHVKINMWSISLNFCLKLNCCQIFDFLLYDKSFSKFCSKIDRNNPIFLLIFREKEEFFRNNSSPLKARKMFVVGFKTIVLILMLISLE